jgi:transglutaminase/protease-like cytokinesis protein 3
LSNEIGEDFQDQNNLIRAIYVFIASKMTYDLDFGNESFRIRSAAKTKEELNKITDSELERALRLRKGVCWENAYLFKKLCYYQGIDSEVIPGMRRVDNELPLKPDYNHVYNVVELYGEKKFIDCTFPAPIVYDKSIYDRYYLIEPEEFIYLCYPEDVKKQYLDKPLTYFQFKNLTSATEDKLALKIKNVYPRAGILRVKGSQKTSISLELGRLNALDEIFVLVNNRNVEGIEVTKSRINLNVNIRHNDYVMVMGRKVTDKGSFFYNLVNYIVN